MDRDTRLVALTRRMRRMRSHAGTTAPSRAGATAVGVLIGLLIGVLGGGLGVGLAGCHTVEGAGRDIEETGENIQKWSGKDSEPDDDEGF